MSLELRHPDRFLTRPDAIIFDTDNTLYHYDGPHAKASKAAEEKASKLLGIETGVFREAFTTARNEIKARLGATASSHSRLLYFQRAIEILGLKTQLLATLDLEQTYWRTFLTHSVLFDDVKSFLSDLKTAGIHTAIITDLTSQIQFRKIIYFGLDSYFDYVVTSEEAGIDKPAAPPFQLALEKLKVEPKKVWMIGDHPVSDIGGAHAFGLTTLQKRHHGVVIADGALTADLVFDEFGELREFMTNSADGRQPGFWRT